jgi:cyclopropane fatty-acyl-phospholipid synthase-like methyltransferase
VKSIALGAALLAAALAGCEGRSRAEAATSPFPKADRPIAEIVSNTRGSEALRDQARESEQLIDALGIRPGQTVADIGAGAGYHTVRMSPVVGPNGRVLAVDVEPRYLEQLKVRVADLGLTNVTTILGGPDDPRLPANSTDVAIMIHMYHEVESPYAMLHRLAPALKPGGKVAVVDFDRPTERHGTPPALLRCEFAAVGWRQVSITQLSGDVGYLAVYAPHETVRPEDIKPCKNRVRR